VLNHQRSPYLDPNKDTWTTLGYLSSRLAKCYRRWK